MPNLSVLSQPIALNVPQKTVLDENDGPEPLEMNLPQKGLPKQKIVVVNEINEPGLPNIGISIKNKLKTANRINQSDAEPVVIVEELMSDEAVNDTLPYAKRPLTVPMPFFPLDSSTLGPDEFRNGGSMAMQALYERGAELRKTRPQYFMWDDDDRTLPAVEDCVGVIFSLIKGPVAFFRSSPDTSPDIDSYRVIVSTLDETYEPIYLIANERAYQVSAEQYLETYGDIIPPLALDNEEEPVKKKSEN